MFTWPQDFATNFQFLLRWLHFLAGITWIGMLYFFNLVNVKFQKELDAATKGKVVPNLMPKALWWFRWGAMGTWLTGFIYYFLLVGSETTGHMPLVYFLVGLVDRLHGDRGALPGLGGRGAAQGRPHARRRNYGRRPLHLLCDGPDGPQRRLEQPDALDHGGRRTRHDHVPQRLDGDLAAPAADHRSHQGHSRDRSRRTARSRPPGRAARFWLPGRMPGCRSRCSSSWAPPATSRSFRRSRRWCRPRRKPPGDGRTGAASGPPLFFGRLP